MCCVRTQKRETPPRPRIPPAVPRRAKGANPRPSALLSHGGDSGSSITPEQPTLARPEQVFCRNLRICGVRGRISRGLLVSGEKMGKRKELEQVADGLSDFSLSGPDAKSRRLVSCLFNSALGRLNSIDVVSDLFSVSIPFSYFLFVVPCLVPKYFAKWTLALSFVFDKYCPIMD